MTLLQFYQQRFGADPYALIDAASTELALIAGDSGISWNDVASDIQLVNTNGNASKFSVYTGHAPAVVDKSFKGRCDLYSRIETKNGLDYPFINFVVKGHDGGVWSGLDFLWSEYRRSSELSGPAGPLSNEELERIARAERQRAERERKAREAKFLAMQHREQALLGWKAFNNAFEAAGREDGSWPYAVKKGVSDVFSFCDVRRVTVNDQVKWAHGPSQYMAIPLRHLDNRLETVIDQKIYPRLAGWQRIDFKGNKLQTNAVDSGDFTGSCHVIGSLENPLDVCVVEGFATGASVWLATHKNPKKRFDAVIVAVSANNMIHVVDQLVNLYPAAKITCALDNDRKSAADEKGNTGLRTGFEILEKHTGIKCVYPTFKNDPELTCSDFNDLHNQDGLQEVCRQLFASANRLNKSADLLSLTLNKLKTLKRDNRRTFAKELLRAVDTGMLLCPVPYSPNDLYQLFCITLNEIGIENIYRATVKDHIARRLNRKCRSAQTPRSFSERITDPNKRPSHITYRQFQTSTMTSEILDYVKQLQGIVIVRAGMGSGKSTGLLRPLMHQAQRGVSVAHRVSLIGGLHEMMTKELGANANILHYQDEGYKALAPYANKLTVCINSIVKGCWQPLIKQHDFFGLDEATQGLRAILSGRAMENPVGVFNTLIDALARTEEHPVMVDADANDLLIDLAELAMKRREELGLPAWLQIHVIELPVDVRSRESGEAIRVFYTQKDRIMTEVMKSVGRGEKIMLATDNSSFAEDVTAQLQQHYPDKKFLCVNQDRKTVPEVEEFTNAPQKQVKLYDGLIYSPSISSGVSIEEKHFDRHFGMFCGEVVPSDAIQMLRRDRTAQEFVIGFDKNRGRKETDPEKIKRAYAQALLETAASNGEFTDVIFEDDMLSLGVANSSFMQMKIKAAAMEASARNDFASNMVCIMHSDGYKIAPLGEDLVANGLGKELRKEAREIVWTQTVDRHMAVETPAEHEYEQLVKKRAMTLDEQAQLARWDIEHDLMLNVNEDNLKFYFDGGREKIRRYETMLLDEMTAHRFDREEAMIRFTYSFKLNGKRQYFVATSTSREQADAVFQAKYPAIREWRTAATPVVEIGMRGFYTLKSTTLQQYFRDCGIDPLTMDGEATQETLKHARDNLMKADRRDLLNNVLRIGGFSTPKGKPKTPEAVFKNICDSLGLRTDKRRARVGDKRPTVRFVDQDSAGFMLDIIEQRKDAGLTVQTRKAERADVVDHGLDLNLYSDPKPRSTFGGEVDTAQPAISTALAELPVPVTEAWARSALTKAELDSMQTWSIASIALTFASLYLTEFMDRLSSSELHRLKDFINGKNRGGHEPQEAIYG